jgi:hypothetical protein
VGKNELEKWCPRGHYMTLLDCIWAEEKEINWFWYCQKCGYHEDATTDVEAAAKRNNGHKYRGAL